MPKKESNKTSPYFQAHSTAALFKASVVQYLEMLRMPMTQNSHEECRKECHIAERNHTIGDIKHFITNVGGDN